MGEGVEKENQKNYIRIGYTGEKGTYQGHSFPIVLTVGA